MRVSRQIGDARAFFFESLASVEDGFVLDGGGDDVRRRIGMARRGDRQECLSHNPKDGVIVGFGAAAGEDDFLRAGTDEGGDLFARRFHRRASLLAEGVDGGGVPEFPGEIRQHGVKHFRLDGGGGVEIEIDAVHKATHRILLAGEL